MIGYFSDKIGRINVAALSSLIAGLASFFLWIFAGKYLAGLIIYALFGAFAGCIWPCIAPVAVEVVGLQLLPSAMSVTWLVMVLPATFAEVIGLSLVTPGRDGYLHVQVYTGAMFVAAFASRKICNTGIPRGFRNNVLTALKQCGRFECGKYIPKRLQHFHRRREKRMMLSLRVSIIRPGNVYRSRWPSL